MLRLTTILAHLLYSITPLGKHYWSSTVAGCPPSVEYKAVIQSEDAVLAWLENVVSLSVHRDCRLRLKLFYSIPMDFAS